MHISTVPFLTHLPGKFAVMVNNAKPQEMMKASHQVHGDRRSPEKKVRWLSMSWWCDLTTNWTSGMLTMGGKIPIPHVFGTVGASC